MPSVLITGGAGFIGSHLGFSLLADGVKVRALDNLDPFYDVAIKRRNLDELQAAASSGAGAAFEFHEADIRDPDACRRALEGVDVVVHLAALAGVRPSIQEPERYMDVNVTGTQVLLSAIDSRAVRVVFGSSSSVYGGNRDVPFGEDQNVDRPVSPYAASKKAGEVVCHSWHHLRGNPLTCLRFFTVYGPGQRPEMAIHKFARCIVNGDAIPFFGDGSSARDYTYVADIVAGVRAAVDRPKDYAIYNLGGSATTTLRELVELLEGALGQAAVLDRLPDQPGDVPITYADIGLARRELDYEPTTPIAAGIEKFCAWYRRAREEGRFA